jgi:hypothetical protein
MALSANLYAVASNEYENSLTEAFRKDNGAYYTDVSLAEKMLSAVKQYIKPDTSTILYPCCGAGSFLYAANRLCYQKVFGIDVAPNAVKLCNESIDGIYDPFNGIGSTATAGGRFIRQSLRVVGLLSCP